MPLRETVYPLRRWRCHRRHCCDSETIQIASSNKPSRTSTMASDPGAGYRPELVEPPPSDLRDLPGISPEPSDGPEGRKVVLEEFKVSNQIT